MTTGLKIERYCLINGWIFTVTESEDGTILSCSISEPPGF
jgi:hypothetical protein